MNSQSIGSLEAPTTGEPSIGVSLDAIIAIFAFLTSSELLQAALVSKTRCKMADEIAEQHLLKTEKSHSVSDDWRVRLVQHLGTKAPPRLLWNVAQVLPLKEFNFLFEQEQMGTIFHGFMTSPTSNKSVMLPRRDGILILDIQSVTWTLLDAETGDAKKLDSHSSNYNVGDDSPWKCAMLSLERMGNYLVLFRSTFSSETSIIVWKANPDSTGPQFLHYTVIDIQAARGISQNVYAQDGMLVMEHMDLHENWGLYIGTQPSSISALTGIPPTSISLLDKHQSVDEVLLQHFDAKKEIELFYQIIRTQAFDLETGQEVQLVAAKPYALVVQFACRKQTRAFYSPISKTGDE